MTYFLMYLLTIVDNIGFGVAVGAFLSIVAFIIVALMYHVVAAIGTPQEKTEIEHLKPLKKTVGIIAFVLVFLDIMVPSQKGLAFIIIAPQIIENGAVKDTVKNIPELTQLGTEYLKELLKEKVNETKQP